MSAGLEGIRVILLDIEGTTTPVAFVHDRLFTYAREHLDRYLAANLSTPAVQAIVRQLTAEYDRDRGAADLPAWRGDTQDATSDSVAAYVRWLMDRDRKSPGLKSLQGLIWQAGYQAGAIHGEVFDDVPRAMARWREAGVRLAIYSSGSELAQRLLFASTRYGDLTPLITAFFDTAVGAKTASTSYRRIARALARPTSELLFISDVSAELTAAAEAGCQVRLCVRPGPAPSPNGDRFVRIWSFDDV